VVAVQVGEDLGHLPAEHSQQRQFARLEDRHLDAGGPGRGGGFQADPPAPMTTTRDAVWKASLIWSLSATRRR
jgi:hypothetical protein